jgi:hypothetical protein
MEGRTNERKREGGRKGRDGSSSYHKKKEQTIGRTNGRMEGRMNKRKREGGRKRQLL